MYCTVCTCIYNLAAVASVDGWIIGQSYGYGYLGSDCHVGIRYRWRWV